MKVTTCIHKQRLTMIFFFWIRTGGYCEIAKADIARLLDAGKASFHFWNNMFCGKGNELTDVTEQNNQKNFIFFFL
jgi:hypothetical protein